MNSNFENHLKKKTEKCTRTDFSRIIPIQNILFIQKMQKYTFISLKWKIGRNATSFVKKKKHLQ